MKFYWCAINLWLLLTMLPCSIAIADWDLNVNVNGTGSVSSSPAGISTSTSQTFRYSTSAILVTLTATGDAPTAVTGNYTITEGNGLALNGSSSLAGSTFFNWTGPDAPIPGPGNPDKVNPLSMSSDGLTDKSITANFTNASITSFGWVLGTGTGQPNFTIPGSSATPSVSWASLVGAGFAAGNTYSGRLTVGNGTTTNSTNFSLTINSSSSSAVPEPSSILLLSASGIFMSFASKRTRKKLTAILSCKRSVAA
jgi:hypothetical protein